MTVENYIETKSEIVPSKKGQLGLWRVFSPDSFA